MFDAETLGDQSLFGCDHIFVAVVREPIMQPVTGLARTTKSDRVGQDKVILGSVKRLTRLEHLILKTFGEKLFARASRAVNQGHRIFSLSGGWVIRGWADRSIVEF